MATGKDVIKVARSYLGDGGSRFWSAYGCGAVDWCAIFVWYVMHKAGAGDLYLDGEKTAWVPTAQQWLSKNCKHIALKDAREGDIVIMTWDGTSRDHIGFAIKPLSSAVLQTIEGNTGSKYCTKSEVDFRKRNEANIYGIYRPAYTEAKKVARKQYKEIRKYECVQVAHSYKGPGISTGRVGKDTRVGSTYSAVAWRDEWLDIPAVDGWVPTTGSGGTYLKRRMQITYIVTNASGVNIYKERSIRSQRIKNIRRGSELTVTQWYGAWGYVTTKYGAGWVAMSCLTEAQGGALLYREMEIIAEKFKKAGMRYSIEDLKTTLAGALKDHRTDCAHYVSFGLQALGILPVGQYIWLNKKINGNGADDIRKCKAVTISYPRKKYTELSLKIGDIVGYGYRVDGKEGQHTQVFAGYDKQGYPLWFSAGTSDVKGKSYGPKRKPTYEGRTIDVLIRIK
jgi:hypothetical protein